MSAVKVKAERWGNYGGAEGFYYPKAKEEYEIRIGEMDTNKDGETSVFTPEIYGLTITGILSALAIIISWVLNYTMVSLIFMVPFVGVLIGVGYIGYLKKYGKYH